MGARLGNIQVAQKITVQEQELRRKLLNVRDGQDFYENWLKEIQVRISLIETELRGLEKKLLVRKQTKEAVEQKLYQQII